MGHISICFAVYQNQGSLTPLYERMVYELKTHFPHHTYELLFVNDGSKDDSHAELLALRKRDDNVKIISFSRNFGQMAAILAGWDNASGDCVINMAADLQDPPEQCTLMIREWEQGNDIVISYRISHGTSPSKKLTSKIFYKLMLPDAPPGGFDFALLDRKPMDAIKSLKERHRFYQYDILWVGFKVKYIPYHKLERQIGKSQYDFLKRLRNFYSGFLNVSYFPLRLMTIIGGIVALSGFAYAITIIQVYFMHKTPFQGWAPIMILILVIGGLIMLMLGMLGEYVWRILDEVKGRPNYIIKEKIL
ncbi:MAG: glycosyltransferase family 2 protein [Anaerolineales bacterium]|nr:glycosyltransferase family 2 protein [Anaerolineales bacterium]